MRPTRRMKGILDKKTHCGKVRRWDHAGHLWRNAERSAIVEHSPGKNRKVDWFQIKEKLEGHAYPYKMEGL